MKTGDGEFDTSSMESAAIELFLPVLESASILAAHYCKACNRNVVLAEDMRIGLMYAARNVLGKQVGTLFPELEDEEDEEEEEEEEEEDEEEWSRYEGAEDDMAVKMNECAASWSSWVPANPSERALKAAVDKQLEQ
jgi:Ran GTPase-activating protein (RanGAP) involved in mRNA processing and transport